MIDTKYDEFVERLEKNHPQMFDQPYGGICVGEGWWPIIESLCSCIQSHIDFINRKEQLITVQVRQVKEKFGGLRFYYDGGDDYVDGLVRMAEAWADKTCEVCGKPGKRRNTGWVRNLCDEHEAEYQSKK